MAQSVEQFALDLLDLTHPEELETLLVKGPSGQELETVTHAVELERKNVRRLFFSDKVFYVTEILNSKILLNN